MKKSGGPGSRYSRKKKESRSRRSQPKKHTKHTKHRATLRHSRARKAVPLFFKEKRVRERARDKLLHVLKTLGVLALKVRDFYVPAVRWFLLVLLALGIMGPGIALIQIGTQNFYLRGLGILALLVVVVKVLPLETKLPFETCKLFKFAGSKSGDFDGSKVKSFFLRLRQLISRKPHQKPADNGARAIKVGQLLHLGAYETEIDALYQWVTQKRAIRIKEIARRFKVPEELVQEWAKILEEHKLISIHYPSFGSPILKLYEEPQESPQGEST